MFRQGRSRRGVCLKGAALVALVAVGITCLATSQTLGRVLAAPATPTITRQQMLARAQTWVDAHVPYNQAGWFRGYREDCSGFVSMAWALSQSYTTYTMHDVAYQITKDQLQPGDILNKRTDVGGSAHVVLFVSWADPGHTAYNAYEENPYWGGAHLTMGIPFPYWPGSYRSVSDYMPMRLDNFNGTPAAVPPAPPVPPRSQAAAPTHTAAPATPPAPISATVYIGDAEGTVHALDGLRSRELWRFATGGTLTMLSVANGQVLVATAGQTVDAQGDRPLFVAALNASSGQLLWRWRPECLVGAASTSPPLACGVLAQTAGTIFVATQGAVTALNAASGQPLWTYGVGTDLLSGFALDGTTVYLRHTGVAATDPSSQAAAGRHDSAPAPLATLDALSSASGARLWTTQTAGGVSGGLLAAADGVVYAGFEQAPAAGPTLQAYDGRTGNLLWHASLAVTGLLAPAGTGTLYVTVAPAGQAAALLSLVGRSGVSRWSQPCGASAPIVAANTVYAVCAGDATTPEIAALNPATGKFLWRHTAGTHAGQVSLAAVADGVVYATTTTTTTAAVATSPTPTGTATPAAGATNGVPATASSSASSTLVTTVTSTTALSAQSGASRWQRAGTVLAAGRNIVTVADAGGTLTVLAAWTGTSSWLFALGASSAAGQVAITA